MGGFFNLTARFGSRAVLVLQFSCLGLAGCASHKPSQLPSDIRGLTVGMSRADAEKRLAEIGNLQENLRKRQQIWRLKDDPNFESMVIQYGPDDSVRYVTAFVGPNAQSRIPFADVGDLSRARSEITEPHYRYIWDVSDNGIPGYQVVVYGDNAQFLSFYTLVSAGSPEPEGDG